MLLSKTIIQIYNQVRDIMKIEDIQLLWNDDSVIDRGNLIQETLKIPLLHSKYYNIYLVEKKLLHEHQEKYKQFFFYKFLYYQGKLSKEDLDKFGWEQCDMKYIKSDVDKVIDSDNEVINYKLKIANQEEKTKFLENIIKTLNNRSFITSSAMEAIRFEHGIN